MIRFVHLLVCTALAVAGVACESPPSGPKGDQPGGPLWKRALNWSYDQAYWEKLGPPLDRCRSSGGGEPDRRSYPGAATLERDSIHRYEFCRYVDSPAARADGTAQHSQYRVDGIAFHDDRAVAVDLKPTAPVDWSSDFSLLWGLPELSFRRNRVQLVGSERGERQLAPVRTYRAGAFSEDRSSVVAIDVYADERRGEQVRGVTVVRNAPSRAAAATVEWGPTLADPGRLVPSARVHRAPPSPPPALVDVRSTRVTVDNVPFAPAPWTLPDSESEPPPSAQPVPLRWSQLGGSSPGGGDLEKLLAHTADRPPVVAVDVRTPAGRVERVARYLRERGAERLRFLARWQPRGIDARFVDYAVPSWTPASLAGADDSPAPSGNASGDFEIALRRDGIDLRSEQGGTVSPIDGCPNQGPTLCLRDGRDSIDPLADDVPEPGAAVPTRQVDGTVRAIVEAYPWAELYRLAVRIPEMYGATELVVSSDDGVPFAVVHAALEMLRFRLRESRDEPKCVEQVDPGRALRALPCRVAGGARRAVLFEHLVLELDR